MKTGFKKKTMIAALTLACMCSLTCGAIFAANAEENEPATTVQTLTDFECAGASVNATATGMRFQFNLSGDAVSYSDRTAGVVYMPYDLYKGDTANFTKDTPIAATATFTWEDNQLTTDDTADMVGYTYMNASVIPKNMYNRVLLVRGYIEDGETVYYTDPERTSMAFTAWKGISVRGETYREQLQEYMGPYTLTYGDGENDNVNNLYYGETVPKLPETIDGYTVRGWYWDMGKTQEIKSTDYVTGSMRVYYKFDEVTISGKIDCVDKIDLTQVKISVDGKETSAQVSETGEYSIKVEMNAKTISFAYGVYSCEVASLNLSTYITDKDVMLTVDWLDEESTKTVNGVSDLKTKLRDGFGSFVRNDSDANKFTFSKGGTQYFDNGTHIFKNTSTTEDYEYTVKMSTAENLNDVYFLHGLTITNGTALLSFQLASDGQTLRTWYTENAVGNQSSVYKHWITTAGNAAQPWYNNQTAILTIVKTSEEIKLYAGENKANLLLTVNSTGIVCNAEKMSAQAENNPTITLDLNGFFGESIEQAVGVSVLGGKDGKVVNYTVNYKQNVNE